MNNDGIADILYKTDQTYQAGTGNGDYELPKKFMDSLVTMPWAGTSFVVDLNNNGINNLIKVNASNEKWYLT